MPNVVVIVKDIRIRKQAEQFLNELEMDDLRYALFNDHEEFSSVYFRRPSEQDGKEQQPEEIAIDPRLFSEVNLMIFALDSIHERPLVWLDKLKLELKKFDRWPKDGAMRSILLKYEDDGINKIDLNHPMLDDIVFLPMDRLIFLQKVEILFGLPAVIKPSFLFNQEIRMEIEISKISKLDRLSDVALAIRNPISLRKGVPGHFYLQLPKDNSILELWGKVLRSEPHPDWPGQYLVYFSYFGLSKSGLSRIRQALSKTEGYGSLYSSDPSLFRFNPNSVYISSEETRVYGVAVIDPDEDVGLRLADQLSKDMDRLMVVKESSYQLFLYNYLSENHDNQVPPSPTEGRDFFSNPFTLSISPEGFKCVGVNPAPQPGDYFIGHTASDLFGTPDKWMSIITDEGSRVLFEECVSFALRGRTPDKMIIIQDSGNVRRAVQVTFNKGNSDTIVKVTVRPASLGEIASKMMSAEHSKELSFLILDSAYVPEDPTAWVQGLRSRAVQVGLIKESTDLRFFITTETSDKINPALINNPDILGLFVKPVDVRQMLFLLSEYLSNRNTLYQFQNIGWAEPILPVHVSKAVDLEALSEFGATLKSKQPIVPGTIIHLRKSIFHNAPEQCVASRVYACEPHPSEKDAYQIFVTYFGITDQFLKFARSWIRENYAQQKEKEGG